MKNVTLLWQQLKIRQAFIVRGDRDSRIEESLHLRLHSSYSFNLWLLWECAYLHICVRMQMCLRWQDHNTSMMYICYRLYEFLTDCSGGHVSRNVLHSLEREVVLDEEVWHGNYIRTYVLITAMRTCMCLCGVVKERVAKGRKGRVREGRRLTLLCMYHMH